MYFDLCWLVSLVYIELKFMVLNKYLEDVKLENQEK